MECGVALVALIWTTPNGPASHVMLAGPNTKLFMWMLAWDTHPFTHQPLAIFDANI